MILDFLGVMSGESALSLDCLFSDASKIPRTISREILSLFAPFILFVICTLYWYRMLRRAKYVRFRRTVLSLVVVLYVSYVGLTRRMIRILYCIDINDGTSPDDVFKDRYWTEDTTVKCYTGSHAYLVGLLVVPMLALLSIAFPSVSAFVLVRQKISKTLHTFENKEMFGFMFCGYRDEFVFWDSVIMFRKALLALVVGFGYPLGSMLQGAIASFVLFASVQLQIYLHPFHENFSALNHLEVFSLCVSVNTFIAGIILTDDTLPHEARVFVSFVVVIFILTFIGSVFFYVIDCVLDMMRHDLETMNVKLEENESRRSLMQKWMTKRGSHLFYRFIRRSRPSIRA